VFLINLACSLSNEADKTTLEPASSTATTSPISGEPTSGDPVSSLNTPTLAATNQTCCVGAVTVAPYLKIEGGRYVLNAYANVTLTWAESPRDAIRVEFYFAPGGTGIIPQVIAADDHPADGAAAQWIVPESGLGTVSAAAFMVDGSQVASQDTLTYSEYTPPSPTPRFPGEVTIASFVANRTAVNPGEPVTFIWNVRGAQTVSLYMSGADGVFVPVATDQPVMGAQIVLIPAEQNFATGANFELRGEGNGETRASALMWIAVSHP
jgi:hypothetical protein